jgi:hypothetical protein
MQGISSPEWEGVVQSSDASIPGVREKNLDPVGSGPRKEKGKVWSPESWAERRRPREHWPCRRFFRHRLIHASTPVIRSFFLLFNPHGS